MFRLNYVQKMQFQARDDDDEDFLFGGLLLLFFFPQEAPKKNVIELQFLRLRASTAFDKDILIIK